MYKKISGILALSTLIWFGNSFAAPGPDESPLADLHKGTLVLPCVYVLSDDGATPIAYDVRMNQRGSSMNWKVVDYTEVEDASTECPEYEYPVSADNELANSPDEDESEDEGEDDAN